MTRIVYTVESLKDGLHWGNKTCPIYLQKRSLFWGFKLLNISYYILGPIMSFVERVHACPKFRGVLLEGFYSN